MVAGWPGSSSLNSGSFRGQSRAAECALPASMAIKRWDAQRINGMQRAFDGVIKRAREAGPNARDRPLSRHFLFRNCLAQSPRRRQLEPSRRGGKGELAARARSSMGGPGLGSTHVHDSRSVLAALREFLGRDPPRQNLSLAPPRLPRLPIGHFAEKAVIRQMPSFPNERALESARSEPRLCYRILLRLDYLTTQSHAGHQVLDGVQVIPIVIVKLDTIPR
jgi:hypothetical protein